MLTTCHAHSARSQPHAAARVSYRFTSTRSRLVGRTRASGPESVAAEAACLYVLRSVVAGQQTPEAASKQLATLSSVKELFATHCQSSTYVPKIIQGAGSSAEDLVQQMSELLPLQRTVLVTQVPPHVVQAVELALPDVQYNARAKTLSLRSDVSSRKPEKQPGSIAIVSGCSSDLAVAEECKVVAEHVGCYSFQLKGLGVLAMDHVLANLEAMRAADVVVVVSGRDTALPSVLAGLVDAPVIAVPTSAGQATASGGISPLLASLGSSTPVSVVNIDDGRAAAMMAMRILRQAAKLYNVRTAARAEAAAAARSSGIGGSSSSSAGSSLPVGSNNIVNAYPSATSGSGRSSSSSSSSRQTSVEAELKQVEAELMIMGVHGSQQSDRQAPAEVVEAEVRVLGPRCAWPATKIRVGQ